MANDDSSTSRQQQGDPLTLYGNAIAAIESSGSGGYRAIGPTTRKGDRALGRYQVMQSNVPEWTKAATGTAATPSQFLADSDLQDTVFRHHFGGAVAKYGNPQDAASEWFTGRPLAQGGNASDGYINGNEYVRRFNNALGYVGYGPGSQRTAAASPGSPNAAAPQQPVQVPGQGQGQGQVQGQGNAAALEKEAMDLLTPKQIQPSPNILQAVASRSPPVQPMPMQPSVADRIKALMSSQQPLAALQQGVPDAPVS